MPEVSTLLLFAVSALALVAVPGPNLIYIVARSLDQGSRAGIASALGVETGTIVHITAAAVGLSAALASSAAAFSIVKYAGVAYLLYLAARALTPREQQSAAAAPAAVPAARVYVDGLLVQLLNPTSSRGVNRSLAGRVAEGGQDFGRAWSPGCVRTGVVSARRRRCSRRPNGRSAIGRPPARSRPCLGGRRW